MIEIRQTSLAITGSIRRLTPEVLHSQARDAAEQGIPLVEANHHEPGSALWHLFNNFYRHTVHQAECAESLQTEVTHG